MTIVTMYQAQVGEEQNLFGNQLESNMSLTISVLMFNMLLMELMLENYFNMSYSFIRCVIFLLMERLMRLIVCPRSRETANLQYTIETFPSYGHFWTFAFFMDLEDVDVSNLGMVLSTYNLPFCYPSVRVVTIGQRGTTKVVNLVPGNIHFRSYVEFQLNFEQLIYFPPAADSNGWEVVCAKSLYQRSHILVVFRPKPTAVVLADKLFFFVLNLLTKRWRKINLKSPVVIERSLIYGLNVDLTGNNKDAVISVWNPTEGSVTVVSGSQLFRKRLKRTKFEVTRKTAAKCYPLVRSSIFHFNGNYICMVPIASTVANEFVFAKCIVAGTNGPDEIFLGSDLILNCRPKYDSTTSGYHLFKDSSYLYLLISPLAFANPAHQLCLWRLDITEWRWYHIKDISAPATTVFPVLAVTITSEGLLIIETKESTVMHWIRVPKLEILVLRSLQTVDSHINTLLGNDFPRLKGFQTPYNPYRLSTLKRQPLQPTNVEECLEGCK